MSHVPSFDLKWVSFAIRRFLLWICVLLFAPSCLADALGDADLLYKKGIYDDALKVYQTLASQGSLDAQARLADMYLNAKGVAKDSARALSLYLPAAQRGNARAQTGLGIMHQLGDGVPKDLKQAVHWFQLAALQDDDDAELYLGAMLLQGEGIPRNVVESVRWTRLSAEQGNTVAQYVLGLANERGVGMPIDSIKALMWYEICVAHDFERNGVEEGFSIRARNRKLLLAAGMSPDQITEALRLVRIWKPRPANASNL
jgi:TPR repeat protein